MVYGLNSLCLSSYSIGPATAVSTYRRSERFTLSLFLLRILLNPVQSTNRSASILSPFSRYKVLPPRYAFTEEFT